MSVLLWLFSFVPIIGKWVDPILAITKKIVEWKTAQLNATTEQQRIAAEEAVKVLEAQRDVMIAEAQYNARSNQIIRIGFVIPVATYIWILLMWDKVACKWMPVATQHSSICSTDPIDSNMWWIVFAVVGWYFLQNIAHIVARK